MVFILNYSSKICGLLSVVNRQLIRVNAIQWAIMSGLTACDNGTLRHLRYREKLGGKLPVPGVIELVVIGSGRNGTPQSLIVSTSHSKYLFNCGEGTQRIASENKMRLSRIEHVFLTRGSWDNIGGLMGMCLTLEATGIPTVTLHGPPRVESQVTTARTFAQLRSLQLVKREISAGDFVDDAIQVQFIPIFPAVPVVEPDSKKQELLIDNDMDSVMSIVHICQPHPKPRTLSLEKCVDHNVPAGPLMGQLKEGQEVTLETGQLVRPDDVLEPLEPSYPFIVVDCPSMAYVESLVNNKQLQQLQTQSSQSTCHSDDVSPASQHDSLPCNLIVHFTPSHVVCSAEYNTWMTRFGENVCHLVLNDVCSDLVLESIHNIQAKLNLIHSDIFPLLPAQPTQVANAFEKLLSSVVYGETNMKYIYRGKNYGTFNRELCVKLNCQQEIQELTRSVDFNEALRQLKQQLTSQQTGNKTADTNYPEILFLGTGSAMPNKVRNVSAIWINISASVSMLLDCGENTLGQLYRYYGPTHTVSSLKRLRAIYISHLHADHHLGVIGLALERHRLLREAGIDDIEPLIVLAAHPLNDWYQTLNSHLIPIQAVVRFIPVECLYKSRGPTQEYEQVIECLGLSQLNAVAVRHRQHPHGVVLGHADGWKIAYSGDTMPCEQFVELGRDCDVVIHEATMEDDLKEDASEKRHSTTSQAIEVGIKMNAKFIMLTHFSQRYAKIPIFNENFTARVGIAFDNMKVRLCDLPLLPLFTPVLKAMFAEDYADMEEKSDRKKRRKLMK